MDPVQNNQTQSPTPVQPMNSKTGLKSKWPLILIGLLILIILPLGAYFLLNEGSKNQPTPTATPTPVVSPEPSAKAENPSPTPKAEMKTYTSKKLANIGFSGYTLKYPADWTQTEERDESVGTSKLKLAKGSYGIVIQQGPMGGAQCIYEGVMPEGPATDKRGKPYTDLITSIGTLRRDEAVAGNGEIGYSFCQKSDTDDTFGSFTKAGAMSYGGPVTWDPKMLTEMDSIIKSIQVLP